MSNTANQKIPKTNTVEGRWGPTNSPEQTATKWQGIVNPSKQWHQLTDWKVQIDQLEKQDLTWCCCQEMYITNFRKNIWLSKNAESKTELSLQT